MAIPGTAQWALEVYGAKCSAAEQTQVKIFGRMLTVHKGAKRFFRRLDRIFAYKAPGYYALICRSSDVSTYSCRVIAGTSTPSNHSWPIAIDLRSAENGRTADPDETKSEMWKRAREAVLQAEREEFRWGGRYGSPDPMHFEPLVTPEQLKRRYFWNGRRKPWYRKKTS